MSKKLASVLVVALTTVPLIVSGGVVTGLEAGMAVPDWLTTFDYPMMFFPLAKMQADTGVYVEHFHRLWGLLVGLSVIILVVPLALLPILQSQVESLIKAVPGFVDWVATTLLPWIHGQLPPVKLLTMKKHWGSCSPSGSIVLNPHLVKAPRNCIDYVILHELCHLKEHNHSPQFWRLMDRVLPNWQKVKRELDDKAEILLND